MWDHIASGALIGAVAGCVGGVLAVVLVALVMPAKKCPDCGGKLPKLRAFGARAPAFWVCRHCGCEVDRKGNKVAR
jgi:hypothetical protein